MRKGWTGSSGTHGRVPRSEPKASEAPALAALALAVLLLARAAPCAPGRVRPVGTPPERGAARLLFGLALDPNHEQARALEALPGIGPARAEAIVTGRPYCGVEDLARVPGIGPVTLRRLTGRVRVEPSPACARGERD